VREGELDDPNLAEDVVGVASARLLAARIPAPRRLAALRLLGVLGAVADGELRVRRPLAGVAAEFGLDLRTAATALDDLVAVRVVGHDDGGLVLGGAEPPAAGALRLHDFLALADDAGRDTAPAWRAGVLLRPAAALLAAAALVAAVLLAPGALRQPATPVSSHGGILGPSVTSTSSIPGTPVRPAGRTPARRPSSTTATSTLAPGAPCPPGGPILDVLGIAPQLNGNLAVSGRATNPTDQTITIRSFTVHATIAGQDVGAPGVGVALVVPPHGGVDWTATLPAGAAATDVTTVLGEWQWQGQDVPPGCSGH
jgi:hypothetical protein